MILAGCTNYSKLPWISSEDDTIITVVDKGTIIAIGSKRNYLLSGEIPIRHNGRKMILIPGLAVDLRNSDVSNFNITAFQKKWGSMFPLVLDSRVIKSAAAQLSYYRNMKMPASFTRRTP